MAQASDSEEPVGEPESQPLGPAEMEVQSTPAIDSQKIDSTESKSEPQVSMPNEADSSSNQVSANQHRDIKGKSQKSALSEIESPPGTDQLAQNAHTIDIDGESLQPPPNEVTLALAEDLQKSDTMDANREDQTLGSDKAVNARLGGHTHTVNENAELGHTGMAGTEENSITSSEGALVLQEPNTDRNYMTGFSAESLSGLESGLNPGLDFDRELVRAQQDEIGLDEIPFQLTDLDMTEDIAAMLARYTYTESGMMNNEVLPESTDPSDQLFCPESEEAGSSKDAQKPQSTRGGKPGGRGGKASSGKSNPTQRKKGQTVTRGERKKTANAFESFKNGQKKQSTAKGAQEKAPSAAGIQKEKGKRKPRAKRRETANIQSIYAPNTLAKAKENAKVKEELNFTAKAKKDAVKQMIDQVEGLDRGIIETDERAIMEAITRFKKRPRADGEGGWRHTHMETSLYHYQLLGVGFMREREASTAAPFGGFLCDEMGFGKTIQAIANIVDDDTEPNGPNKTLIVAPAHLVPHWENEISKHVKRGVIPLTMQYTRAHKAQDSVLKYMLETDHAGIIITTYGEIRRSCPDPSGIDGIKEWADKIDKQGGVLHRHKFRRIVLDEAHEIKNHLSKISLAVRCLSGVFRWVVTGTPIHNSDEEFYPYFDFLNIPRTGTFNRFCKLYCPGHTTDRETLHGVLRTFMLRRTHQEKLFGLPVLKLPDVDEQSILIEFGIVERHLYRAMAIRCVRQLFRMVTQNDDETLIYRCYLTYLLHLRMFTSHLLLCPILEPLATPDLLQEIRGAVADRGGPEDLEACYLLERLAQKQDLPGPEELAANHPTGNRSKRESYTPGTRALIARFLSKLNSRQGAGNKMGPWEMVKCKGCEGSPFDAYIMSCMHVVCHNCFMSKNKAGERINCACGAVITEYAFYHAIESLCQPTPCTSDKPENRVEEALVPVESAHLGNWVHAAGHLMQGAKLKAACSCIREWFKEDPNVKVVVFIQFLDTADILGTMCDNEGWGFGTLTGRDSPATRADQIRRFSEDPAMRVMIASLKAGGIGLDLTMATRCILIDQWWNDAVEMQAFCRLYRIGQKNPVKFVKLCVRNSIDDRIGEIQEAKSDKIERAMGPEFIPARATIHNVLAVSGLQMDANAEDGFSFIGDKKASGENDATLPPL